MKELILVRNAQTRADIELRHEGTVDYDLTPAGRNQARSVAAWLSGRFTFDLVLSSPLLRAFNTAIPIADAARQRVEVDQDLNDRNLGILGGLRVEEASQKHPLPAEPRFPHEPIQLGESRLEFRGRVERAWWKLQRHLRDGQRCCLVAPADTLEELFRCFLGMPTTSGIKLQSDESAIHYWLWSDSRRIVYGANITEHLNALDGGLDENLR